MKRMTRKEFTRYRKLAQTRGLTPAQRREYQKLNSKFEYTITTKPYVLAPNKKVKR